jgi:hypothetical protein
VLVEYSLNLLMLLGWVVITAMMKMTCFAL